MVALLIVLVVSGAATADEATLSVELASGRTFTGELDTRTDGARLWLRSTRRGISVHRPIAWSAIRTATLGEETITIDALRARADSIKNEAPPATRRAAPTPRSEPSQDETRVPPVANLHVEASIANWDNDVETDGIMLTVLPLDAWGGGTVAEGTVEVELIVDAPGTLGTLRTFPIISRWTVALASDALGPNGYVYRLPYQAYHPEFNVLIGQYGLVHCRLSVPGQGTFDASASAVTMRPFSPMRDRQQSFNNQRFFSDERTGQGKMQVPQQSGL
ncbi:MAG TPA: hypothetical protein VHZ24_17665 [Pirellulales bacterium]|nr:hypothetical protein [Pirellulales bacterium]